MDTPGLEFITSASISAASSIDIDNCFSSNYYHYLVRWNLIGSLSDRNLRIRMRSSGSTDTGTNYRNQGIRANATTVDGGRNTGSTWFISVGYSRADGASWEDLIISNPFDTVRTTMLSSPHSGGPVLEYLAQTHDLTNSYDGMTFLVDSGTLSGGIQIWGYSKS